MIIRYLIHHYLIQGGIIHHYLVQGLQFLTFKDVKQQMLKTCNFEGKVKETKKGSLMLTFLKNFPYAMMYDIYPWDFVEQVGVSRGVPDHSALHLALIIYKLA